MTLASVPIAEAQTDLFDPDGDRWTGTIMMNYLNAGEQQIAFFKPTAYVVTGVYQLVAGTKQSLPDGSASFQDPSANTLEQAVELVRFSRNMGSDGATAGDSIYTVNPVDMDELSPGWRSVTAAATVVNVIFNPDDRTVFDVYPAQPSSSMGWIEAKYSAVPTALTAGTDSLNLNDEYLEPLKVYMKFRAYSLDAANSQFARAQAVAFWNLFLSLIGRKDLVEQQYRGAPDGSDSKPVSQ